MLYVLMYIFIAFFYFFIVVVVINKEIVGLI